jgi:hypothetical protein
VSFDDELEDSLEELDELELSLELEEVELSFDEELSDELSPELDERELLLVLLRLSVL